MAILSNMKTTQYRPRVHERITKLKPSSVSLFRSRAYMWVVFYVNIPEARWGAKSDSVLSHEPNGSQIFLRASIDANDVIVSRLHEGDHPPVDSANVNVVQVNNQLGHPSENKNKLHASGGSGCEPVHFCWITSENGKYQPKITHTAFSVSTLIAFGMQKKNKNT